MNPTGRALLALCLTVSMLGTTFAPHVAVQGADAAGNVTTHSSCTTITSSGTHELTSDAHLPDNSYSCISIQSDDVYLDGNSHELRVNGGGGRHTAAWRPPTSRT